MKKELILRILSYLPFNIKYAIFISFLKGKIYHYEESMENNSLIYKRNATHLSIKGEDVNEQLSKNLFETKLIKLELITDGFLVENEILEKFITRRTPDILITDNLNALNWGNYKEIELVIKYPNEIKRKKKLDCKKIKLVIKSYNIEDIKKVFEVINIKGLDEIEFCIFTEEEIYDYSSDNDSDYRHLREYLAEQTIFDNNDGPQEDQPQGEGPEENEMPDDDDSIPDTSEPDENYNPETGDIQNNEVLDFNTLDIREPTEEPNDEEMIDDNEEDLFNFEPPPSVEKDKLFDDEYFNDDDDDDDIKIAKEEEEDEGEEEVEEDDEYYTFKKNVEKDLDENEKKVLLFLKKILDTSRASVIKLNSNSLITFPFLKDKKKIKTLKITYNTGFLNLFKSNVENLYLIDIYQDLIIENKNLLKSIFNSKYKNLIIKTREPLNEKTFQILKINIQTLDTDRLELGYVKNIYHFKYFYKAPIINPNIKELVIFFNGDKMELMNKTEIEREYFKNNKNVYFKLL